MCELMIDTPPSRPSGSDPASAAIVPTNGEADCFLTPGERGELAVSIRVRTPDGHLTELTVAEQVDLDGVVIRVRRVLERAIRDYRERPATMAKASLARGRMLPRIGRAVYPADPRPARTGGRVSRRRG